MYRLLNIWNKTPIEEVSDIHRISVDIPIKNVSSKIIKLSTREFEIIDSDRSQQADTLSRKKNIISSSIKGVKKRIRKNFNLPVKKKLKQTFLLPPISHQDFSSSKGSANSGSTKTIQALNESSRYSNIGSQKHDDKGMNSHEQGQSSIKGTLKFRSFKSRNHLQEPSSATLDHLAEPHYFKSKSSSCFKRTEMVSMNNEENQDIK